VFHVRDAYFHLCNPSLPHCAWQEVGVQHIFVESIKKKRTCGLGVPERQTVCLEALESVPSPTKQKAFKSSGQTINTIKKIKYHGLRRETGQELGEQEGPEIVHQSTEGHPGPRCTAKSGSCPFPPWGSSSPVNPPTPPPPPPRLPGVQESRKE
jgi:hypothetical protein